MIIYSGVGYGISRVGVLPTAFGDLGIHDSLVYAPTKLGYSSLRMMPFFILLISLLKNLVKLIKLFPIKKAESFEITSHLWDCNLLFGFYSCSFFESVNESIFKNMLNNLGMTFQGFYSCSF